MPTPWSQIYPHIPKGRSRRVVSWTASICACQSICWPQIGLENSPSASFRMPTSGARWERKRDRICCPVNVQVRIHSYASPGMRNPVEMRRNQGDIHNLPCRWWSDRGGIWHRSSLPVLCTYRGPGPRPSSCRPPHCWMPLSWCSWICGPLDKSGKGDGPTNRLLVNSLGELISERRRVSWNDPREPYLHFQTYRQQHVVERVCKPHYIYQ